MLKTLLIVALMGSTLFVPVAAKATLPDPTSGLHCDYNGICYTAGERHDGWICPVGYAPCYPGPNVTDHNIPCFSMCSGPEIVIIQ